MGKISVHILDCTENKEIQARLSGAVPVGQLVIKIAEKMKLPTTDPKGNPIQYALVHKESGAQLAEKLTVTEAGLQHEDILRLQAEIAVSR